MGVRHAARWGASVALGLSLVVALSGSAIGLSNPLDHGRFIPGTLRPLGDRDVIALAGVSDWGLAEPGALTPTASRAPLGDPTAMSRVESPTALSDPIPLDPSAPYVAGVTWDGEADLRADARYFRDGGWHGWQELAVDDLTGDRPGTAERRGTEPFIVTGVDAIQVRAYVTGDTPAGLTVRLYSSAVQDADTLAAMPDPGSIGFSRTSPQASSLPLEETMNTPPSPEPERLVDNPQPVIHSRAEWKADVPTTWFESTTVQGAGVHHSAGTNDYRRSEVPSILRSIQDLHMEGRDFWDIAYNFLIDRYGGIWEGRAGGVEQVSRGAHSHSFNPIVTGVCIMGNFQEEPVPTAALNSLVTLLAWKLTFHGAAADGILLHEGTWPAIIGHKDIPESSTSCPGKYLYALLPEIRARVLAAQHLPAAPFTTDVTGDGTADLVTILGDLVVIHSSGYSAASSAPFQGAEVVADFSVRYDLITAGPSLTGGPGADVVARQASTGFLVRLSDDGTGALGEPVAVGYQPDVSFVLSPGDITGDGIPDIVTGDPASGLIAVHAGDGAGHLQPSVPATSAFGALAAIGSAGDVDGNGTPDLVVIVADSGELAVLLGDGKGGFAPPVVVSDGWGEFDEIAPMGDVSGDGLPDLLVRNADTGRTRTLLGGEDGLSGDFVEWRALSTQWDAPMGAVGWELQDGATLLARDAATGNLVRPVPTALATASAPSTLEFSAPGVRSAAVAGDVDHNGFADVLTWGHDGLLLLHPSTGTGFDTPILVSDPADSAHIEYVPNLSLDVPDDLPVSRPYWQPFELPDTQYVPTDDHFWSEYTSVAPAGDIDFDGTPDLVAVTRTGDVIVYTLDSSHLARPNRGLKIAQKLEGSRVFGVGPWRPSSISDLIAVSPTGDVRIITGKGMTGARIGKVVATGWGEDDVLQGLGQVGASNGAAVSLYDAETGEVVTMGRTAAGDWEPLG